jgi:flagellar hook-associated protein 2
VTITINSTNSTLRGVRDAINNANAGVTATIVNSGSSSNPYELLIRANNTGTAKSFTITPSLSGGQALSFAQTQPATDAQFSVNGVNITKSSNTASDVIDGVTLTLKAKTDGPVIVSVAKDVDSIGSALQNFVTAYNAVNSFVSSQFTYNSTTKTAGVLAGNSTLRNVQSLLRNPFNQSVSNRYTNYRVAGQVGLEFDRNGNLTLNTSQLKDALTNNFTAVAALFLGDGTPPGGATASDSRVTCAGQTSATQSGSYPVQVDSLAQQASVVGGQTLTTLSADETLTITSGTASAMVPLLAGDSISTALSKINSVLSNQGMAVNASDDGTGKITIATNGYGSAQNISVVSNSDGSAGTTGFGTSPVSATGTDIAGEINGDPAIGTGLTLTGAAGQPEEGLSLNIAQSTTGDYGTVTVAPANEGVEGSSVLTSLFSALQGLTDPLSNPIQSAEDGINQNITALNQSISDYQARLQTESVTLTNEYNQANEALQLLTVNQAQLTSQIATLSSSSSS